MKLPAARGACFAKLIHATFRGDQAAETLDRTSAARADAADRATAQWRGTYRARFDGQLVRTLAAGWHLAGTYREAAAHVRQATQRAHDEQASRERARERWRQERAREEAEARARRDREQRARALSPP